MTYMQLMEWESALFIEAMEDDCLVLMAKGLGLNRILLKVVQTFCKADNLVIVLNTIAEEQNFYLSELDALGVKHLPKVINTDVSIEERRKYYLQGGVFFVSSRILVVDMLTKRIPIEYITGIMVQRAHKIGTSSQESFILRMYREINSDGFVKGFSDSPTSFLTGYCQVERVMKQLFVRNLLLRPRFHSDVVACMDKHKPDVVELSIGLSPTMSAMQLTILDLIQNTLRDLKCAMPAIDPEQLTLENTLQSNFDSMMKLQLDPIWNELATRTKELVADLKVLRTLLTYLTNYDCVTFYNFLENLRKNEKSKKGLWMLNDQADAIFTNAKERVLGKTLQKKSSKKKNTERPETCPKWEALTQVLDEIETQTSDTDSQKVLICALDDRTSQQLIQVLSLGSEKFLESLFLRSSLSRDREDREEEETDISCNNDQSAESDHDGQNSDNNESNDKMIVELRPQIMVMIHSLIGNSDPYSLLRRLYEFQPTCVILYDATMEFVRQLEVYKASHSATPLRVYFLFYTGSIEEQRYLSTLRSEKNAFELLIRQKAEMVIPEERQAKSEVARSTLRNVSKATDNVANTRKAGGRDTREKKSSKVIVDMREFRSDLPSLLHRRGIDIEPVTLEVGDYILSPDICVERKSVSDLIGSLNNGRLYNQCVSMTRYYKRAVLLIEFDESRSFSLQAKGNLKSDVSLQNISSKLSLLTIHFPKLKIIWSQSPHLTAEIFEDLKSNTDEPDAEVAMSIGIEGDTSKDVYYNIVPQDMVHKLPGVNYKNYRQILNNFSCLKHLINSEKVELNKHLGNTTNANLLCDFFNKEEDSMQPISKRQKK